MPYYPPRPGTVRPGLYRPEQPSADLTGSGGILEAGVILGGAGGINLARDVHGSGGIVVNGPLLSGTATLPPLIRPIPPGGFAPTPTARPRRRFLRARGGITVAGPLLAGSGQLLPRRLTGRGRLRLAGPLLLGHSTLAEDALLLWLLDVLDLPLPLTRASGTIDSTKEALDGDLAIRHAQPPLSR